MNSPSEAGMPLDGFEAVAGAVATLAFRSFAAKSEVSAQGPAEQAGVAGPDAQELAAREAALLAAAREAGFQAGEIEGRSRARAEMAAELQAATTRQREQLGGVVEEFGHERARYFAAVEQEVVKLALAIAARVLHREAQMDGLLLSGAVRVALETIADRSTVVLRSSVADVAEWEISFAGLIPGQRPGVVGDPALERGACVLETRMGTVELGVKTQLEEIEKGFFDLLNHRPVR